MQKKPPKKLPKEVISHWPEVFKEIDVNTDKTPPEELEKSLEDLFEQYKDHIRNIDFRLNTQKVKSDIKARTSRFLKLRR